MSESAEAPLWLPPGLAFACGPHDPADAPPGLGKAAQRRQLDHAAGRRAAAKALRALTGQPGTVGKGADGAPVWPKGVVGAISHSGGSAVAVVAPGTRYAGIGIDLETPTLQAARLSMVVMSPDERQRLGGRPDALAVTLAFSAKESLFKALYPSLRHRFGFDAAEMQALGEGSGALCLTRPLARWQNGARFEFGWGWWGRQLLVVLAVPA